MKNIYLLFTVLFVSFSLFSCGSDDDENYEDSVSKAKVIKLNNEDYSIISAIVLGSKGAEKGKSLYTFTLSTANINSSASGKVISANVVVEFPETESIDGTYEIDKEPRSLDSWLSSYNVVEFKDGQVVESGSVSYNDLTEGFCTIKHNGNKNYTVYFKFKPKGHAIIEGGYSGDMQGMIQ